MKKGHGKTAAGREAKGGKKASRITPLGDRVLIRELDEGSRERREASGIIIPATVKDDKGAKRGEVVAVGEGRYEDGTLIPVKIAVGSTVLYQWGDELTIDGVSYTIVSESNVLGIITK